MLDRRLTAMELRWQQRKPGQAIEGLLIRPAAGPLVVVLKSDMKRR
jgi:hypothetical protein